MMMDYTTASRRFSALLLALAACTLATAACSDAPTAAEDGPDPSDLVEWRSGAMVVGKVIFFCDDWYPEYVPGGDPVLVDWHTSHKHAPRNLPPNPGDHPGPTAEQVQLLEDAGMEVVRTFDVPVVRAWMPRSMVGQPSLVAHYADHIRVVVDPDRWDVGVTVAYSGTRAAAVADFEALGGVVQHETPQVNTFSGVIPDPRIDELRDLPNVKSVGHGGTKCFSVAGE